MKKKSLSIIIAVALAATTILPVASVFAATTTVAPVSIYGVEYEGQVENIGWQAPVTTTGDVADITAATIAGTVHQGLRVEAVKITGTNLPAGASITYQAQVQNKGWMTPVTTTGNVDIATVAMAGTQNQGLRVEAFRMTLNGLPGYAIEYQTQVQNKGWMDAVLAANGTDVTSVAMAGTQNQGLRMEGLRIQLVKTTAEKTSEVTAIDAVTAAETSKAAVDVQAATTAVTAVKDTAQNAALTARLAAINVPLVVTSVSAINGVQAKVVFTQAVAGGTNSNAQLLTNYTINGKNPTAAVLQADGKTVILTFASATTLTGVADNGITDAVVDVKPIESAADATVISPEYVNTLTYKDTVRPTITSVTYTDVAHAVIHFSEPVKNAADVTITRADGVAITTAPTVVQGTDASTYTVDLHSLAIADQNQNLNVTFTGGEDAAGNLLNPNPAVVSVKYDNTNTTPVSVSSIAVTSNKTFDVKFSGALATTEVPAIGDIIVGSDLVTGVTQDVTDPSLIHVTLASAINDLENVTINNFGGLNLAKVTTPVTKVVNFGVSSIVPTVNTSAVQTINGLEYLVLTYNENVVAPGALAAATGTDYDPTTSVTNESFTYGALAPTLVLANGATTSNQIKIPLTSLASGAYTINVPAAFATDVYGGTSSASTVSFTRTGDSLVAVAPTATVAKGATNNKVEIAFNSTLDVASALNTSNYSVEGATITGAILTVNSSGVANVELTLANDSDTYSNLHFVKISGVKSATGVAMNAYSNAVNLTENVRPTVTAAKLTDTKTITLTLSKAAKVSTEAATDLDVYAGGVEIGTGATTAYDAAGTTATITLTDALTAAQLASGIVVKPHTNIGVTDVDGNALNFTSIGVN